MAPISIETWQHEHVFLGAAHDRNERRTWIVVGLTAAMMVGEIIAGVAFGSMALLADGWHMATHAGALGIAGLAYRFARRHAKDARFSFGTGKIGDLAGFTSAIVLGIVAVLVAWESLARLRDPVEIAFGEAIFVAVLGLGVNLASAALLGWDHDHAHEPGHAHEHELEPTQAHAHPHGHAQPQPVRGPELRRDHGHGHGDHNLRAAYLHVLADALTSILAIVALAAGRLFGWYWLDPAMGLVGAAVILRWSHGLARDTGRVLLDVEPDPHLAAEIRHCIETLDDDRVADLHLWRVGPRHVAAIVSVVTARPREAEHYRALLAGHAELVHVTIEVLRRPARDAVD